MNNKQLLVTINKVFKSSIVSFFIRFDSLIHRSTAMQTILPRILLIYVSIKLLIDFFDRFEEVAQKVLLPFLENLLALILRWCKGSTLLRALLCLKGLRRWIFNASLISWGLNWGNSWLNILSALRRGNFTVQNVEELCQSVVYEIIANNLC